MRTTIEICWLALMFTASHLLIGQYVRRVADSAEHMGRVLHETRVYLEDLKDRLSFLTGYVTANRASLRPLLSGRKLAEARRIIATVEYQLEVLEAARSEGGRTFAARFLTAQTEQYLLRGGEASPAPWEVKLDGLIQLLGGDLMTLRDTRGANLETGPGPQLPFELCLRLAEVREAGLVPVRNNNGAEAAGPGESRRLS